MTPDSLQKELQRLMKRPTEEGRENEFALSVDEQVGIVNALQKRYPHSISLVCRDSDIRHPGQQSVNCYEYAFKLFAEQRYWDIIERALFPLPAVGLLVHDLIADGAMRPLAGVEEGAVVVYKNPRCYSHV